MALIVHPAERRFKEEAFARLWEGEAPAEPNGTRLWEGEAPAEPNGTKLWEGEAPAEPNGTRRNISTPFGRL